MLTFLIKRGVITDVLVVVTCRVPWGVAPHSALLSGELLSTCTAHKPRGRNMRTRNGLENKGLRVEN